MMEQDQTIGASMGEKKNVKDQDGKAGSVLEELRIPTQVKLAGLWATVMFMYIYVDIIGFFTPGVIADILVGKACVFEIEQTWLLTSVMLMTHPRTHGLLVPSIAGQSESLYEHRSGRDSTSLSRSGLALGEDQCLLHVRFHRGSRPSLPDRMDRMEVAHGPKVQCGRELK